MQLVLGAIPIFYLSIFKLHEGVGKRWEGTMRQFLWKFLDSGKVGNGTCISRKGICMLVKPFFGWRGVPRLVMLHLF